MAEDRRDDSFLKISSSDLKFERLLGSGGFGDVYSGRWISRCEQVAIKKLRIDASYITLKERNLFFEEMTMMHRIRFPYVLNVFGVCLDPGCLAIVVEYMSLGSLYDVIRNKDLTWPDRWSIASQMTKGVNYLHQFRPHPIIHRDIKSFNFLMALGVKESNHRFHVKVGDFGLSRFRPTSDLQLTADGQLGTLLWKAPELFDDQSSHTTISDVYSLGVCFWELVSGQLPYEELTLERFFLEVVLKGKALEIPSNVPDHFATLIISATKYTPDERPTCLELLRYIENDLRRQGLSDSSTSESESRVSKSLGLSTRATTSSDRRTPKSTLSPTKTYSNRKLEDTIKHTETFSAIKLEDQAFTNDDMVIIGTALTKNQACQDLALRNSDITAIGVTFLSLGLATNRTLTSLDLSENPLESVGVSNLARTLHFNSTLTTLRLNSTNMGDDGLKELSNMFLINRTLEFLTICDNHLTYVGVRVLCDALEHNTSLRCIDMSKNKVGDGGAASIGRLLRRNSTLSRISMNETEIGDDGLRSISDALEKNNTLRQISLANNLITDGSIQMIIVIIETNRSLRSLELRSNNLSSKGKSKIRKTAAQSRCDVVLSERE
ncbi:unnamed protein product [Adineta ricciae]|uniref:Protein kinase domain-containing protein n=1 Tax=Adineta ricciae TaxID=249248 RepID=A0A816B5E8_ADIRI|nr:unnamed protein product [Adineta ricciae]CAF1603945.1 unnamed protein product [Adineta ricciae]